MKLELTISDDAQLRALVQDLIQSEIKSIVRAEVRDFIRTESERMLKNALNDEMEKEVKRFKRDWFNADKVIRSEIREYLKECVTFTVGNDPRFK